MVGTATNDMRRPPSPYCVEYLSESSEVHVPRLESSPFDAVPEVYDRVRPSYPEELFDALFAYCAEGLGQPPTEVLEVGPGTGQATASLLARGVHITAVELGPGPAAFLSAKFADEPRLKVVNAAFEDVEVAAGSIDMIVSATAYHWIDADVRWTLPHRLLRENGVLALIDTVQVASEADRGYFAASQDIYDRWLPGEPPGAAPAPEDAAPQQWDEFRSCGLFEDIQLWQFRWDQRYERERYIDLVRSYSGTNRMEPAAREGFLAELGAYIDDNWDGYVVRPLVMALAAGRRCSGR